MAKSMKSHDKGVDLMFATRLFERVITNDLVWAFGVVRKKNRKLFK
jgi:hypothetical protein